MDSEIFEKLPPTKLFFRCAIPSMITMAFSALYQIADGLFVGRFIGEFIISYFYEYFNRLLDIHPYLCYNLCVEYLSPEAVYRSTTRPD